MKTPADPSARRRLIALLAAGITILALVGVGIYGLLTGPDTSTDLDESDPEGPVASSPTDPRSPMAPRIPTVPRSSDPEQFARTVATALFAWDTSTGFMPLDYTSVILAVGDPSGNERAGLASDIATYLPTREAWVELRHYATAEHLSIDDAFVPEAWGTAVEQARPGQLAPGTVAHTIEGTRHRSGVWNDEPVTSEHQVAFTVFITCPPGGGSCYLLRLSQLDNPSTDRARGVCRAEEDRSRCDRTAAARPHARAGRHRRGDEPRRERRLHHQQRDHRRRRA